MSCACMLFRSLHAAKALVLAAGVWTGGLLAAATGAAKWRGMLAPRRGHLLELMQGHVPAVMPPLAHGMMEMAYTKVTHRGGAENRALLSPALPGHAAGPPRAVCGMM